MRKLILGIVFGLSFAFPKHGGAEPSTTSSPLGLRPCVGYDPERRHWGLTGLGHGEPIVSCPKDMAIVFHLPLLGPEKPRSDWPLAGSCCPVPSNSLLSNVIFASGECPEGSVVTGARYRSVSARDREGGHYELACSPIDRSRYQLGEKHPTLLFEYGRFYEYNSYLDPSMGEPSDWSAVPSSIRYGFGRLSKTRWSASGCAGYPWGSVMTKMGTSGCRDFEFREIVPVAPVSQKDALICRGIVNLNNSDSLCVLGQSFSSTTE